MGKRDFCSGPNTIGNKGMYLPKTHQIRNQIREDLQVEQVLKIDNNLIIDIMAIITIIIGQNMPFIGFGKAFDFLTTRH